MSVVTGTPRPRGRQGVPLMTLESDAFAGTVHAHDAGVVSPDLTSEIDALR